MKIEEISSEDDCAPRRRTKKTSYPRTNTQRKKPKYDFKFFERPDPSTIKVSEARKKLKAIKKLANTMDDLPFNPFPIPIGLDTIIGLVPLIGDPLTLLIALYQVWLAFSGLGLPYPLVGKMLVIVLFDFFVGLIPVVGDIIDTAVQANIMNHKIAEEWFEDNVSLYQLD
ncbi:hypothetical protein DSO57_1034044 [Entomophthora muscae]|uniref:Uncharacterized protein n=1 Tax=Entomophthora muscae TaxID=34485 RepID=A0ACC2REP2_9FUNG|nr:hypothetical protein DSO57_1034044 [Entomophthora muscae]